MALDILTTTENAFQSFISASIGATLQALSYDVLAGGYGVLVALDSPSGIICSAEQATEFEPRKNNTKLKLGAHHEVNVTVEVRGVIDRAAVSASYANYLDVVGSINSLFATGSLTQDLTNATSNFNCVDVYADSPAMVKGFMSNAQGTNTHWVYNKNFTVKCGLRP